VQNERILAAEEVPLASLRTLQKIKEGEIQISEGDDRVSVYRVVKTRPAAIDEATAMPRIQQFLFSQRTNEAIAKEIKRLREIAKIDYAGEFSADPTERSPAVPQPGAVVPSAPPSQSPDFDKGLRGLK